MTEMVERVARAMVREVWDIDPAQELKAVTVNGADLDFMELSRAAIAAMREPTERMKEAGEYESYSPEETVVIYHAMIDEALR